MNDFSSHALNNLRDSIEDALTSDSPQDILDCIMLTLKEIHSITEFVQDTAKKC